MALGIAEELFIGQVIWKDHVFIGLCSFMGENLSQKDMILPGPMVKSFVVVEIITYLICHVNSDGHVFRGLHGFMRGRLL